jgi:hypothetical protein
MRRHSHGCHRLHNHIALRLMSFVLARRPHDRIGSEYLGFRKQLAVGNQSYLMDIKQGGYVFKLKTPLLVNVEEGRVRGQVKAPIEIAMPRYNTDLHAYVMPDGSRVRIRGAQLIQLSPPTQAAPLTDAGKPGSSLSATALSSTLRRSALPAPPAVAVPVRAR